VATKNQVLYYEETKQITGLQTKHFSYCFELFFREMEGVEITEKWGMIFET